MRFKKLGQINLIVRELTAEDMFFASDTFIKPLDVASHDSSVELFLGGHVCFGLVHLVQVGSPEASLFMRHLVCESNSVCYRDVVVRNRCQLVFWGYRLKSAECKG